jgi:hypothetical protein
LRPYATKGDGTSWTLIINIAVTVIFGTLLTALIQFTNARTERYRATSDYLAILTEPDAPGSAKALALSALLRFRLFDPDLVLTAGYTIERESDPATLRYRC